MFHRQETPWPNYRLGVPHWHTILLLHTPSQVQKTEAVVISLFICMDRTPQHTLSHTHTHNGVFPNTIRPKPLVWIEWNRLSSQHFWTKAFLSLSRSFSLSFCPPYFFSVSPSLLSSHHQPIKSLWRHSNWWVPFNKFTHGYILQSSRKNEKSGWASEAETRSNVMECFPKWVFPSCKCIRTRHCDLFNRSHLLNCVRMATNSVFR